MPAISAKEILLSFGCVLNLTKLRCKDRDKDSIYCWLKTYFQPDCLIMFGCGKDYFYDPLSSEHNDLDRLRDEVPHIDEIYKALLKFVNEADTEERVIWTTRSDKWVAINRLMDLYGIQGRRTAGTDDLNLGDIEKALGPGFKCIYKVF